MYGKILEPIQNENTKFNPTSPYAISKLYSHLVSINYESHIIYFHVVFYLIMSHRVEVKLSLLEKFPSQWLKLN